MSRPSSIDLLPDDIRDALHALLRDPAVSQLETCRRVNKLLAQEGSDKRVSKSALNRYSQRMDTVGEKMRQSRQIAEMWIGKLGNQPQGEVGKLLNEFTRTMAFETALSMSEEEEPVHPKLLKELSLSIKHLEEAASVNQKREEEIRTQMAAEAADKVEKLATQRGMSKDDVAFWRQEVLGMGKT